MCRLSSLRVFLMLLTIGSTNSRLQACRIQPPYSHHKVVTLTLTDNAQLEILRNTLLEHCEIFLLSGDTFRLNHFLSLLVNPEQFAALKQQQSFLPPISLYSDDFQAVLASSPKQKSGYFSADFLQSKSGFGLRNVDTQFYSDFRSYEDFLAKWDSIARLYAAHVTYEKLGESTEGRDIVLLRIGQTDPKKPKRVFLNGLQHAREWIAAPVPTYIAEVLAFEATDGTTKAAEQLQRVEILVAAMVNPDGYEYAKDIFRFQRKNRRRAGCFNSRSDGVDLNRNWGLDFGGPHATSMDPCESQYIGSDEFSETETQILRRLVVDNPGIKAHIDFHSYGQLILGAWSYTDSPAPNATASSNIGLVLEKEMTGVNGHIYEFGTGSAKLYLASGVMSDWMTSQNILSYTIELRPAHTAVGFLLPPEEILPTCEEGLAAARVLVSYADDLSSVSDESPQTDGADVDDDASQNVFMDVPFIVGVSFGGFVVFVLVLLTVFIARRSRRKNPDQSDSEKESL